MKPTYSELFERVKELEKETEDLEYDCDAKDEEITSLERQIESLEKDLEEAEKIELDISTLDQQMMYDWIKEHWNELRLENLKCLIS